jgi:flagellar biogenesis protein FliO
VTAAPAWVVRLQAHMPARMKWLGEAQRHVRIVQAVPLGPGSRLLVVEFGGRRLLIGQARTGLVRLADAAGDAE